MKKENEKEIFDKIRILEIESYEKLVDLIKTKKEVEEELDLIKDKLRKHADGEKLDWAFPDLKIKNGTISLNDLNYENYTILDFPINFEIENENIFFKSNFFS